MTWSSKLTVATLKTMRRYASFTDCCPRTDGSDRVEITLVAEYELIVEVDVLKPSEAMEMEPPGGPGCVRGHTVEAPGHEMRELPVSEKVRLGHLDPGISGHAGIRVLDPSPRPRIPEGAHTLSRFPFRRHSVEFDEPGLLAGLGLGESRAHPVRPAIPED